MSFPVSHEKILKQALKNGGQYADLFIENSSLTNIQMEDQRIERAMMGIDAGAGIRIIHDFRTIYGYTTEINDKALLNLADTMASAVKNGGGRNITQLVKEHGTPWHEIKIDPAGVSLDEKIALVRQAESTARKIDTQIRQVRVNFVDSRREIEIATSTGAITQETRLQTLFLVFAVASDGEIIQTGYETLGGAMGMELFEKTPPEEVAKISARRAVMMLKAPVAPAGRMTVVLSSEAGGTMIHEAVGHGLEADLAEEGLSVYAGKLGEKIASCAITVVDDATVPGARGSYIFDDEGTRAQRTVLIENGILKSYMHSRLSAMKAGTQSTGNGRRENYRYRPIVRMSTTMILPGTATPEDIIKSVDKGLFVKKMGGGQVNTVNGDFVFDVAEGYLIEKGKIGSPVRNATLIGNGPQVLLDIEEVGNDLGFAIGTCGKDGQGVPVSDAQPTLKIPEITVGGRN